MNFLFDPLKSIIRRMILIYRNKLLHVTEKGLTQSWARIEIIVNVFDLVPNSRNVYGNNFRFIKIILISSNAVDSFVDIVAISYEHI